MGLQGMINDMLERCDERSLDAAPRDLKAVKRATGARSRASSPRSRTARPAAPRAGPERGRRSARSPRSASPAPAARASPRSPTSWSAASGSTRTTRRSIAVLVGRPVAAQDRRRAARRPHPHERDPRPERLHALARDARRRQRGLAALRDAIAACKAAGIRPRAGRDLGHRPGRRGDRAARRRVALRHDARSTARRASSRRSTCSTSPTSSRSTSSTARGAEDALRDVRKQIPAQPQALHERRPKRCRSSAPSPRASTTMA